MFRGAIEAINENSVSGWVFSDDANVTGRILLAFVGDACVGSGKVGVFRQDLKDAGLGDGRFGFSFGITVEDSKSKPVVIRFEGTDAMLLASDGDIVMRGEISNKVEPAELRLRMAQLNWLAERGVVKPTDFIVLRDLLNYGHSRREVIAGEAGISEAEVEAAFCGVLSVSVQSDVEAIKIPVADTMAATIAQIAADDGYLPVIGLFSTGSVALRLLRGSHLADSTEVDAEPSSVQVRVRSPKLTLLDTRLDIAEVVAEKGNNYIFAAKLKS